MPYPGDTEVKRRRENLSFIVHNHVRCPVLEGGPQGRALGSCSPLKSTWCLLFPTSLPVPTNTVPPKWACAQVPAQSPPSQVEGEPGPQPGSHSPGLYAASHANQNPSIGQLGLRNKILPLGEQLKFIFSQGRRLEPLGPGFGVGGFF